MRTCCVVLLFVTGCPLTRSTPDDVGTRADAADAPDAAMPPDAHTPDAAGALDASVIDARVIDPSVIDASVIDPSVIDARVIDPSVIDAAVIDAGVADAAMATDAGVADAAMATDAGPARLPPWLSYCQEPPCSDAAPVVIHLCPESNPTCTPTRSTTILARVDGKPVSSVCFPVIMPEGMVLHVITGNATILGRMVVSYTPRVELHSNEDVLISYYDVAPVWGGTVYLDFVSTTQTSSVLDSVFFRHSSYDTGNAAAQLHARGQQVVADERSITGVTSAHIHGFFIPTELAGVAGEGNWSLGNGVVTVNYGNPPYIEALGGIMNTAIPRLAHECAHELFDVIRASFMGNWGCLNEGIADALASVSGHLPLQDFGPIGLQGLDFDQGCATATRTHDVGNCYFWQVRKAGLLTEAFMRGIFHPQHVYNFDSCSQNLEHTGNAILVMFTEASGGTNMVPVLDAMGIPHAVDYAAALVALGF